MKYTEEITVNKPIEEVANLFDNQENMKKWMKGLERIEHISGEPGKAGAKSKLHMTMNNRKVEMIETIVSNNMPQEFTGTYETNGVTNIITAKFEKVSDQETRYRSEQEFRFKGLMKLMGLLMPNAFKKQTRLYLKYFKDFAESV